jgi:hypothetical protein
MKTILYLFLFLLFSSTRSIAQKPSDLEEKNRQTIQTLTLQKKSTDFAYICFQNTDKTWGYDILRLQKVFIHQPTMPAITGVKGFGSKESASKIAELTIKKLEANPNEFPTITTEELERLKIVY